MTPVTYPTARVEREGKPAPTGGPIRPQTKTSISLPLGVVTRLLNGFSLPSRKTALSIQFFLADIKIPLSCPLAETLGQYKNPLLTSSTQVLLGTSWVPRLSNLALLISKWGPIGMYPPAPMQARRPVLTLAASMRTLKIHFLAR